MVGVFSLPIQVDLTATQILRVLQRKPRLSPVMIAEETKLSANTVRTVLQTLSELTLVAIPARGIYTVTELGEQVLKEATDQ